MEASTPRASITGQSASANQEIGHGVWLNNGASEMQNVHAHRSYQTANKVGSISLSGVSLLAVDDTVELWVYNDTAGNDVLLSDVSLAVTRMDA